MSIFRWIAVGVGLLSCAVARADEDFVRNTVPWVWMEPLLPERLPALSFPAYYTDLEKAQAQAFAGRYKLALMTLSKVKDADALQVALVKATALAATGRRNEAMTALAEPAVAKQPAAQVLGCRVLMDLGQTDEAIRLLQQHVQQHPQSIAGHYYLAQAYELKGDMAKARDAYSWFDAPGQKLLAKWQSGGAESLGNSAEDIVLVGRAYDRLFLLTGKYQSPDGQPDVALHNAILNIFVRVYDTVDRGYWPAHLAAAEYFLSHDMAKQATEELAAAGEGNPNSAEALNLLGQVALSNFDFDRAEQAIASLRQVDRSSVTADVLECRNWMQQRLPAEAEKVIQRVLQQQPNHLEALGLLAAVKFLRLEESEGQAILSQVDRLAPGNASAIMEVAEALASLRQYPRAAEKYQQAIDRAPWWPAAYNGLGLLYTQSGDEDLARKVLDQAHLLDPFNLRATNYLRLLDQMDKMAKVQTPHFTLVYDAQTDPVLPEFFGEYLESMYPEVCRAFGHEPQQKTIIEVFPTHDAFSVRTTGSPWIGTVGASTGRVIALMAPRHGTGPMMAPFNWAQVLRHEFTHTVTLSATDNRIQHWMTEGLAVQQEQVPMRWEWAPMLHYAVTHKKLFTMDNLTWGFVRPKRPSDRQLAYAQSFWLCQYIEETYGWDALLKLMDQFRNGQSQEVAFPKVLNKDLKDFTQGFFAWTEKQVAGWGYDEQSTAKYEPLQKKGEELVKGRRYAEAVGVWEQAEKLRPMDALPHQRLAGLYLTREVNQKTKAIEELKLLSRNELKSNAYAKRLAMLYRDQGDLTEAARYALQAVYVDVYDMSAHTLLGEIYRKQGNEKGVERQQRVMAALTAWQDENSKKLEVPVEQ